MEHLLRQMQVTTGTFTALLDVVKIHEKRRLVRELQPLLELCQQSSLVDTSLYVAGSQPGGLPGVQTCMPQFSKQTAVQAGMVPVWCRCRLRL